MAQKTRPLTSEELEGLGVLCDSETAARILNRSTARTVQMARSGELPARFVGHRWLFNTKALLELCGLGE